MVEMWADSVIWKPNSQLRWYKSKQGDIITPPVLQQLFISNLGDRKWVDIPIEIE